MLLVKEQVGEVGVVFLLCGSVVEGINNREQGSRFRFEKLVVEKYCKDN